MCSIGAIITPNFTSQMSYAITNSRIGIQHANHCITKALISTRLDSNIILVCYLFASLVLKQASVSMYHGVIGK